MGIRARLEKGVLRRARLLLSLRLLLRSAPGIIRRPVLLHLVWVRVRARDRVWLGLGFGAGLGLGLRLGLGLGLGFGFGFGLGLG